MGYSEGNKSQVATVILDLAEREREPPSHVDHHNFLRRSSRVPTYNTQLCQDHFRWREQIRKNWRVESRRRKKKYYT